MGVRTSIGVDQIAAANIAANNSPIVPELNPIIHNEKNNNFKLGCKEKVLHKKM